MPQHPISSNSQPSILRRGACIYVVIVRFRPSPDHNRRSHERQWPPVRRQPATPARYGLLPLVCLEGLHNAVGVSVEPPLIGRHRRSLAPRPLRMRLVDDHPRRRGAHVERRGPGLLLARAVDGDETLGRAKPRSAAVTPAMIPDRRSRVLRCSPDVVPFHALPLNVPTTTAHVHFAVVISPLAIHAVDTGCQCTYTISYLYGQSSARAMVPLRNRNSGIQAKILGYVAPLSMLSRLTDNGETRSPGLPPPLTSPIIRSRNALTMHLPACEANSPKAAIRHDRQHRNGSTLSDR